MGPYWEARVEGAALVAPLYERIQGVSVPYAGEAHTLLRLRTLPAARLGAKVLATDWSPAMIERFEARVRAEGLSDAEGRVMDAHALEIDDDTFDVTGSQLGSCSCRTRRSRCARWSE